MIFNWPMKKDLPGTPKLQLPKIVVIPPARATIKSAKKMRPRKTKCNVDAAPPLLVLDPDFWSPQSETPRARKQRAQFMCRNAECWDQFSSARLRDLHEENCLSFDKVVIYCTLICRP